MPVKIQVEVVWNEREMMTRATPVKSISVMMLTIDVVWKISTTSLE